MMKNSSKKFRLSILLALLVLTSNLLLSSLVKAADLGVMGEAYPIIEIDFLTFIQDRINSLQKSGQWLTIEKNMQQRAIAYRDRPKAVLGVTKATENKTWLFDPSIILDKSLFSADGHLIMASGTRINPLSHIHLSKALLFFDGDDMKQMKWVSAQEKAYHGQTKLILVNGSLLKQEKYFQKSIYFDQFGRLTKRFGIHHVPAIVFEEAPKNALLRIREVAL